MSKERPIPDGTDKDSARGISSALTRAFGQREKYLPGGSADDAFGHLLEALNNVPTQYQDGGSNAA